MSVGRATELHCSGGGAAESDESNRKMKRSWERSAVRRFSRSISSMHYYLLIACIAFA